MIKFFRNIRQKLITEGKMTNYLKYAFGEIVLVMIGILLALQVNNWNEERKDRKAERYYLGQLQENLHQDSVNFVSRIEQLEQIIIELDSAILMLKTPEFFQKSRFTDYIRRIMSTIQMNPSRAIYDNLITSGDIGLLRNQKLTEKLFRYYNPDNSNQIWDDALVHYTRNVFGPFLLGLEDYTPFTSILPKTDEGNFIKSKLTTMAEENKNLSKTTYLELKNNIKLKNYLIYKYQLNSMQKLLYKEDVLIEIIDLMRIIKSDIP